MTDEDKFAIRKMALEMACETIGRANGFDVDMIIEAARKYETYLLSEKTSGNPRQSYAALGDIASQTNDTP